MIIFNNKKILDDEKTVSYDDWVEFRKRCIHAT